MKVIRSDSSKVEPVEGGIFRGGVGRRQLAGTDESTQVNVGYISFAAGGRNVFHRHTVDQLLYITEGEGIVATEGEEVVVRAGDIVVIPAGEKHWHGATPTTAMTHLSITLSGSETEALE